MTGGGAGGVSAREFRPDIQGLRAVAVAAVVLYHAGLEPLGGGYVGVGRRILRRLRLPHTSHVLSGLDRQGRVRSTNSYARRARGIQPGSSSATLVYRDEHHLTTTFVEALADPVATALDEALR